MFPALFPVFLSKISSTGLAKIGRAVYSINSCLREKNNLGRGKRWCRGRAAEWRVGIMANNVKHVIAVSSGKGGVGKSFVSGMLAVALSKQGFKVGILDADLTGPSIPKMFGVKDGLMMDANQNLVPPVTKGGIKLISVNFLLSDETNPVIWRGPVLGKMIKQFWENVLWEELDYLVIDMPPGTGDVPLTVYQSIPIDGAVIVTTPQDLVKMIVAKSVNMAVKMSIPIYGLIENYSYMECPDCGKKLYPFGESKLEEIAADLGLGILMKLPINPEWAKLADQGRFEELDVEALGVKTEVFEMA